MPGTGSASHRRSAELVTDWAALAGDPRAVAPLLLGSRVTLGEVSIRICEVELYTGAGDPASHAVCGPTPRCAVMFGPAGHAYVYLSYGIHRCLNVVIGPPGQAAAVLLRAGEVVTGRQLAQERRSGRRVPSDVDLARGPGSLGRALGVELSDSGSALAATSRPGVDGPGRIQLADLGLARSAEVSTGPRVGVSGPGGEGDRYPWRYWLTGDPHVSTYRVGAGRGRPSPAPRSSPRGADTAALR